MSFIATVFIATFLAHFVAGTAIYSTSSKCPDPEAPANGKFYFYPGGMTVKYECDPGYTLSGQQFAQCEDENWNSEAPQCLRNDDSSAMSRSNADEVKEKVRHSGPLALSRAAASIDDEGMQSDEASRQMYEYLVAQHYWYPRRALVDPVYYTYPTPALSESQIHWINSLHPEVRDQYLKDVYRGYQYPMRYEDAYRFYYYQPYYG